MSELESGERLQIMLSAEELQAFENWRFEERMPSRAAAVRELLRRGLAAEGFMRAESGAEVAELRRARQGRERGRTASGGHADASQRSRRKSFARLRVFSAPP